MQSEGTAPKPAAGQKSNGQQPAWTAEEKQLLFETIRGIKKGSWYIPKEMPPQFQELANDLINTLEEKTDGGNFLEGFWRYYRGLRYKHNCSFLKDWDDQLAPPLELLDNYRRSLPLTAVVEKPTDWLWQSRIAIGKITLFEGELDQGTLTLLLDLAARASAGQPMPDGLPPTVEKTGVILITPEEEPAVTLIPQLSRAGADLSQAFLMGSMPILDKRSDIQYERPFTLSEDLSWLELEINYTEPALVIIYPLAAILGEKSRLRDQEAWEVLGSLKVLVERYNVACILAHDGSQKVGEEMLHSLAYTILTTQKDSHNLHNPGEQARTVLVQTKAPLGKCAPSLYYSIADTGEPGNEIPGIVWGEECTLPASELLAPPAIHKPATTAEKILHVLQASYPASAPVPTIAVELPEITENNLRVTLGRMVTARQIERTSEGHYKALSI